MWTAMESVWRRERDSNPRYPFGHNGFQDRRYQPLTHPSAGVEKGYGVSLSHLSVSYFDRLARVANTHDKAECRSDCSFSVGRLTIR